MANVLLKEVAVKVGMDEKKLRKLLRDQKLSKSGRFWVWEEGNEQLALILEKAKEWEAAAEKKAATPADNVVQFPTQADPSTAEPDAGTQDPAADAEPEVQPETENQEETEAQ